ncbi:MAG: DUF2336 domain-containing protein [Pseudomonadota bacterium]
MSTRSEAVALLAQIEMSPNSDDRRALLRTACSLFEGSEAELSEREQTMFDDVFNILSEQVDSDLRAEAASRLAPIENGLPQTMRTYAFDTDVRVAAPVVRRARSVTEEELVSLSITGSNELRAAIAQRENITAKVTDELINYGDQPVLHNVSDNHTAEISLGGFDKMAVRSKDDDTLQRSLSFRPDINAKAFAKLLDVASDTVRDEIFKRARANNFDNQALVRVIDRAKKKLVEKQGFDKVDFIAADRRVRVISRKRKVDESLIRAFAKEGMIGEVIVAFTLILDIPLDQAKSAMTSPESLLIAARAGDFTRETVSHLLSVGPAFEALNEPTRASHLEAYQQIRSETAQRVVRFWKTRQKLKAA